MLSSAAAVAAGWYCIRHRLVAVHRRLMLTGSVLGALFFVSYVVKTLTIGDTSFGGPAHWLPWYLGFLQVHVLLATAAGVLGVLTLRWALRANFGRHRRVAPWTATMWFVAAGTGLVVFLLLYVVFPPGSTGSVAHALF
ncbi:MAG: DUF420 domain-containing protein [Firmicutes bacterium]|nr:DUF420 domain-containing protein [Alicyclobacillaceae bacterium]MCL6497648.1 DUF420 domain-containing protein [Bacillota bacterium]